MSLNTRKAGFRVVLIQLPNRVIKVLQDVGLIQDCLILFAKWIPSLCRTVCFLVIERENLSLSTPWIKNLGLPSNEALFGHVLSHLGLVGFEMPSVD